MRKMKRRVRRHCWILLFIPLLIAGLFWPGSVLADLRSNEFPQNSEREYFAATGFTVSGPFLEYFHRNGGLEIFGYPISSAFVNRSGITVQFFQKTRMEWHPYNPDPYKVQLGLLGEQLGYRRGPIEPPSSPSPRKIYFHQTGHYVAYKFLDFFSEHGGVDIFGYPITEMFVEDQRVVQYFQRMKLIWDVGASTVTVGDLGDLYVSVYTPPAEVMRPESSFQIAVDETELALVVDVAHWVINLARAQEVTVVVLNKRTGDPMPDVNVEISLITNEDAVLLDSVRLLRTDERGRVKADLPLTGLVPGTWTTVRVDATLGNATAEAQETFLVWW